MRICDLTMAYSEASGGIRTYIDQKRRYILESTTHEHLLVVPGAEDGEERHGRTVTRTIAAPTLPAHEAYRVFWRPGPIREALEDLQPDVVELGTFFVCPWPAFAYREERREAGRPTAVVGYFHTDLADAYVQEPLQTRVREALEGWGPLARAGLKAAEALGGGAQGYFGRIFARCDAMLAATPGQVARLEAYGVGDARLVPMGVDPEGFHPDHRSEEARAELGVGPDEVLLLYAGRLDQEKRPDVVADAFDRLDDPRVHLLLIGEGPKRDALEARARATPRLLVRPYETDKARFARLLASADVYVTAGPHETFGLSVVEAQASGLPVVGVEEGALVERVPEGLGYLGPVDDPEAMAENIRRAVGRRDELGAAARAHVEERFSWSTSFGRLLSVYDAALMKEQMA